MEKVVQVEVMVSLRQLQAVELEGLMELAEVAAAVIAIVALLRQEALEEMVLFVLFGVKVELVVHHHSHQPMLVHYNKYTIQITEVINNE
jgi:hypothetical protein